MLGGIQPGPLERYLRAVFGGRGDDGLLQRFQLAVWPDGAGPWRHVDRLAGRGGAGVVDLAAKNRLPAIYAFREAVESGGLMAYGASLADLFRGAATQVDKILKGAKPADLPVEQPTKFELVINLKTAKALGLTIPRSFLLRADQVIE